MIIIDDRKLTKADSKKLKLFDQQYQSNGIFAFIFCKSDFIHLRKSPF
jgi:hypothetical protein